MAAADGTGSAARFNRPSGVAVDSAGNVYVADTGNNTIRKVTPGGVVTTLAGLAGSYGSADGTGSAARFDWPNRRGGGQRGQRLCGGHGQQHDSEGDAGRGGDDPGGPGGQARAAPTARAARRGSTVQRGVAVDSAGNVYVADTGNHTIRKVTPAGVVTTLAGLAGNQGSATARAARRGSSSPSGVAVDSAGNVYVADTGNHTIRKVTPGGVVTTLAGLAGSWGSADGTGSAAQFNSSNRRGGGQRGQRLCGGLRQLPRFGR